MKEREYIMVRDLERISSAQKSLSDVLPAISEIVNPQDYALVMEIISNWVYKHYEKIKIKV